MATIRQLVDDLIATVDVSPGYDVLADEPVDEAADSLLHRTYADIYRGIGVPMTDALDDLLYKSGFLGRVLSAYVQKEWL